VISESPVSSAVSCAGEFEREGSGVFASFSKESVRFLWRRRVKGGEGGGLGGRWLGWKGVCVVVDDIAVVVSIQFWLRQDREADEVLLLQLFM
jgi:hypothetical protein